MLQIKNTMIIAWVIVLHVRHVSKLCFPAINMRRINGVMSGLHLRICCRSCCGVVKRPALFRYHVMCLGGRSWSFVMYMPRLSYTWWQRPPWRLRGGFCCEWRLVIHSKCGAGGSCTVVCYVLPIVVLACCKGQLLLACCPSHWSHYFC